YCPPSPLCPLSSSLSPPFFLTDTPTTSLSTLSLHDALPISFFYGTFLTRSGVLNQFSVHSFVSPGGLPLVMLLVFLLLFASERVDRKSTRLNSSHVAISYAVFCLKKKNNHILSAVNICALVR